MTSPTLVWAYKPLIELGGVTGYVDAGALAEPLLAAGAVQSCAPGWEHFRPVEAGPPVAGLPAEPEPRSPRRRAPAVDEDEATQAAKDSAASASAKPRGKVTK
jgi:hypothetical protein